MAVRRWTLLACCCCECCFVVLFQKIPLTGKLDEAVFWLSSEFFSSSYFQIGQHVVLLHMQIPDKRIWTIVKLRLSNHSNKMQSEWSCREGDCMQFDISFTRTGELSWRRLHNQRFYLNGHMTIVLINMGQARVIW